MQMSIETDYAVRCILYMAQHEGYSKAAEISRAMCITKEHCVRILKKLSEAGLVCSQRGCVGGYRLKRPAEKISILDPIMVMEGTIKINRCLEHDGFCSRHAAPDCPVHQYYSGIQSILEQVFGNTTIQDIIDGRATAFNELV